MQVRKVAKMISPRLKAEAQSILAKLSTCTSSPHLRSHTLFYQNTLIKVFSSLSENIQLHNISTCKLIIWNSETLDNGPDSYDTSTSFRRSSEGLLQKSRQTSLSLHAARELLNNQGGEVQRVLEKKDANTGTAFRKEMGYAHATSNDININSIASSRLFWKYINLRLKNVDIPPSPRISNTEETLKMFK